MDEEPDVRIYIAAIVILILVVLLLILLTNPISVGIQTNITKNL